MSSVRGRIAMGLRVVQKVARVGDRVDAEMVEAGQATRCLSVGGISLHANVYLPARDRLAPLRRSSGG
jgi:hypothetical protein